jgi:hypothetical protein
MTEVTPPLPPTSSQRSACFLQNAVKLSVSSSGHFFAVTAPTEQWAVEDNRSGRTCERRLQLHTITKSIFTYVVQNTSDQ